MEYLTIHDLRGGRNGTDPPAHLLDDQCVEAVNVDWYHATLCRKRHGSDAVTDTGGTAFSSGIQTLLRHIPGNDEGAAELWGIDGAATPIVKRMAAGTSFANVTLADAIASHPQLVSWATLNGKLFLAYDSSVDRLHAYDAALSAPKVRRVGLATPAAPTGANTAAGGTYAARITYIRIRWIQYTNSLVVRRSEPSPVLTFTPDGSHTGITVTRSTAASEDETHWEVEASTDNANFYAVAQAATAIAIATTTYDLTIAQDLFSTYTLSEQSGLFTVPTSWKYVMSDGNRLIGAGAWETPGKNSRVWFTPVLGATDHADDERIPNSSSQKNWVDLNENDGGYITGLGGPIDGAIWAFKYRQIWKLIPTGDVNSPYIPRRRTTGIGCIEHRTIAMAEDESGHPAIYFMSHKGPYRIGANGLEYLGKDNEDIWTTMVLGATTTVGWTLWYPDLHQVWFHLAGTEGNDPNLRMVFDVRLGKVSDDGFVRGGWSKHVGDAPSARCGTLFANTLGASMSKDLKPYIGRASGTAIQKCDTATTVAGRLVVQDGTTAYQAYVTTKVLDVAGRFNHHVVVHEPHLQALAVDDTWISCTIVRDYGIETRSGVLELTPYFNESRVTRKYAALELSQCTMVQITLGDATATTRGWTLDVLHVPIGTEESR